MADSFAGQSHIAVTFSAGDLTPKPARRVESLATRVAWKSHFRHHQTMIAVVINVDLNLKIFPRNLVAGSSLAAARPTLNVREVVFLFLRKRTCRPPGSFAR